MDRHAGNGDDTRIRGEFGVYRRRMIRVAGYGAAGPGVGRIAALRLANPGVFVAEDVDRSVVIEKTDDAIGVAGTNATGGFVLLLQAFVANIVRVFGRADDVYVRLGIARQHLSRCRQAAATHYQCQNAADDSTAVARYSYFQFTLAHTARVVWDLLL